MEKNGFSVKDSVKRRGKKGKERRAQKVGKWLQIAGVLLPYNKSNSLLLLLPVFDGQPCPERCPACQQRGRVARLPIILRHVIQSHTAATDILSNIVYFHRNSPSKLSNAVRLHNTGWLPKCVYLWVIIFYSVHLALFRFLYLHQCLQNCM